MSRQTTLPIPSRPLVAAALLLPWLVAPLGAQTAQYSQPGQLSERAIPTREVLRDRIARAPWEIGRWRLQPRLSIGDLLYSNNVFDDEEEEMRRSDLRGSASAGLDAYAPLGPDVVFATFVGPSYQWWRDSDELRRLNWSYGAGVFALGNRAAGELAFRRAETEQPINNELRVPATLRQDQLKLDLRLDIRGPWQVFGSAVGSETRYPNAADLAQRVPNLELLERDQETVSLGVAYDIPARFNLGIGWRRVDAEFLRDPQGRSSTGDFPFLDLRIPGNRLQLNLELGYRLLEFSSTSTLGEREEAVGNLRASFELGSRTAFILYGGRGIVYSAVDAGGFFTSETTGAALNRGKSGALQLKLFAQSGSDEFASAGGPNTGRIDDSVSYGVRAQLPLRWGLELRLGVWETEVDSNLDDFDRSVTSIQTSISLDLPNFPF